VDIESLYDIYNDAERLQNTANPHGGTARSHERTSPTIVRAMSMSARRARH
jgi:hypothetical protein